MAAMPRVARFQTIPSSSSATERLKPWRSLSFMERRTWRRSFNDWACGISSSMVSLAMGIFSGGPLPPPPRGGFWRQVFYFVGIGDLGCLQNITNKGLTCEILQRNDLSVQE